MNLSPFRTAQVPGLSADLNAALGESRQAVKPFRLFCLSRAGRGVGVDVCVGRGLGGVYVWVLVLESVLVLALLCWFGCRYWC